MVMTSRKPSKPWRVEAYAPELVAKTFRGQSAAYEHVQAHLADGWRASVWHWEEGRWCLYERLEPDGSDTDWAAGKNRPRGER